MENKTEEKSRVLVIGATGRVGSHIVRELDQNSEGVIVRLSSTDQNTVDQWNKEGREAAVLDLDKPETFAPALEGVERVFLLTGYTVDMLRQSKVLVDAAVEADIKHIVHLGVFTSRKDLIPHFIWHDMIETYIQASGIAWTNIHPNVISNSILVKEPSIKETGSFSVNWGEAKQGWVFASDIGAVAAALLREGPEKHNAKDYFLSVEVLTGPEVAGIISKASGKEIKCNAQTPDGLKAYIDQIPSVSVKAYMESAYITMKFGYERKMEAQTVVKDDVMTVLGRPGLTMEHWARQYFS
ncbi:NmrA family NAD(P)-binding protein [Chryseobacterium sp. Ch-15]|uniref:NmrA family NAD(P)-binding protein n=1 Tax=Chryseobacterium muglaense TaxID=2893752 RepID=A0A9Q3YQJ7_9FLAO|nr:NmrA family NAD(P)-binding protein [Chryseobacterium muglaense]MBD3906301.1 NmrA family NAD(P)-binding protein [Chryseobacterium muglaense]MCC9033068.1 NmrA family NAD(P)-binding protein [Chryseobacterium muglaense]MCM2555999.1 NmrA family NAD(P)-binding protein [Chryseobacterium muglaense]